MFGLRMLAVKKSIKRSAAYSPRSATIAGTTNVAVGGAMTVSAAAVFLGSLWGGSDSAIWTPFPGFNSIP